MERLQARGEIPEEELKALELDMTGKVPITADGRSLCMTDSFASDYAGIVARNTVRGHAGTSGGL